MRRNRVAAGVVMVPCVLLGAAFLSTAVWSDAAGENRPLALGLGLLLLTSGLSALRLSAAEDTVEGVAPRDSRTIPDESDPSS
jgi:hypothetical protein